MKANEFRIGNLVLMDGKEVGGISEIRSNHSKILYKGEVNGDISPRLSLIEFIRLEPIPLTEEWLVRFGFRKINTTWFKLGNFAVNISLDVEWGGNWMGVRLKYVHQLQNLYFALTGEELTIK